MQNGYPHPHHTHPILGFADRDQQLWEKPLEAIRQPNQTDKDTKALRGKGDAQIPQPASLLISRERSPQITTA